MFGISMRGMQLVRPGAFSKTLDTVSSVVRNTSCSHGWLRLVVQCIFAFIIVTSFTLIVYMAVQNGVKRPASPDHSTRCQVRSCRILCSQTPYYGDYEHDITSAVKETDPSCIRIYLVLKEPVFVNGAIPVNWLSELRTHIHELLISGGNLAHIPPGAFLSQYSASIHTLVFHGITLKTLVADSFVGLSNLKKIYIKNCNIVDMQFGALQAVDETLEVLTITNSGKWCPGNVTGSGKMPKTYTVDFSGNNFQDIIGRDTFTGIEYCKLLYLNSCKITAIGRGAFDHLLNIEMLFLNNNFLKLITPGLFKNMATLVLPKPRINLQDNLWYCDCDSEDIRQLVDKDILLIDPVCQYPMNFRGKTFSKFHLFCKNETNLNIIDISLTNMYDTSKSLYLNGGCYKANDTTVLLPSSIVSSVNKEQFSAQMSSTMNVNEIMKNNTNRKSYRNRWLKFTFFLKTDSYSVVQVGSLGTNNFGLMWYESTCPNEVYCLDTIPKYLRLYNVDLSAEYMFCPILLSSRRVLINECVTYNLFSVDIISKYNKINIIMFILTGLVCLLCGAISVYALIRKNPMLLKGNKRIVFVKHKYVDALVLPPKVPHRKDSVNDAAQNFNDDHVFVVSSPPFLDTNFVRQKSTKSDKSSTPSYVSAFQPTEHQLAEWRIKRHFLNDLSLTTVSSELSTNTWVNKENQSSSDYPYVSLEVDNEQSYESIN